MKSQDGEIRGVFDVSFCYLAVIIKSSGPVRRQKEAGGHLVAEVSVGRLHQA
jgi:hypothetical protein